MSKIKDIRIAMMLFMSFITACPICNDIAINSPTITEIILLKIFDANAEFLILL